MRPPLKSIAIYSNELKMTEIDTENQEKAGKLLLSNYKSWQPCMQLC